MGVRGWAIKVASSVPIMNISSYMADIIVVDTTFSFHVKLLLLLLQHHLASYTNFASCTYCITKMVVYRVKVSLFL